MMCAFQDRDNLYLVMDLLTGGDLRYHICHKKRFTEEQTKFFIACVLLGLDYIHSNNVIHRDIKPENLVCDEKGYIAVTDFGVAKKNLKDNSSETSGTPGYMAPEVLCAQNHSFPVDFFAIGVMGYEFMLGVRPYLGKSRKEIKEVVLSKQARVHRRDVPPGWTEHAVCFINAMLQRKPSHRLGYNGIREVKEHVWFDDFNWDMLLKKKMRSPFQPKMGDNFDKKYCEGVEKVGNETLERYRCYMSKDKYFSLFNNYTFICAEVEELKAKYSENSTASTNTNHSNRKQLAANTFTKYIPHNNSNNNHQHHHHHHHQLHHSSSTSKVTSPRFYNSSRVNSHYHNESNGNNNNNNNNNSNSGNIISSSKMSFQQHRPLSRLSSSNSQLNLHMTYRNYSNHHYNNSNSINNTNIGGNINNSIGSNKNEFGMSAGHTANMINKNSLVFDLNRFEPKSYKYNSNNNINSGGNVNEGKRFHSLSKNSSMKLLNINSNYLSNMNFLNLNSVTLSKKYTSVNKQPSYIMFGNGIHHGNKFGNTIAVNGLHSNVNGGYKKSSSVKY